MAEETIRALRLNDLHHLKKRVQWLILFSAAVPENPNELTTDTTATLTDFASREMQLSSTIRSWLLEQGFSLDYLLSE